MHIKCNNAKFIFRMSVVLVLLFLLTAVFGMPKTKVLALQDAELVNPLDGYSTTQDFDTVDDGAYHSATNPYTINCAEDLIKLAYYVNVQKDIHYATASYRLTKHIDISMYNWEPIGNYDLDHSNNDVVLPFSGKFDGYGYSIYGLTINYYIPTREYDTYSGLFGYVAPNTYNNVTYNPQIKLLGIKDASINSNATYVGGLVARMMGDGTEMVYNTSSHIVTASASIQECYVVARICGVNHVGGMVGLLGNGASIYNCYVAPSNTTWDGVDIYGTTVIGSVGGIAGKVEWNNSLVPAIRDCYNTAKVAKKQDLGTTEYIGGIIGNVSDINVAKYNTNVYYKKNCVDNQSTTAAVAYSLAELKSSDSYEAPVMSADWNILKLEDNKWNKYTRGDTVYVVWQMSNIVNNGLPVLTRVPQLARITLQSHVTGNNNVDDYVDYYFSGYKDINNPQAGALQNIQPIVVDKHNMYIEQGQSFVIVAESLEDTTKAHMYELDDWYLTNLNNSVFSSNQAKAQNTPETDINALAVSIVNADCVYDARFVYKLHAVTFGVNSSSYGQIKAKVADTSDSDFDWDSVEYIDTDINVKLGTMIRLEANAKPGYKIQKWLVNGTNIKNPDNSFYVNKVYIFEVVGVTDARVVFDINKYNFQVVPNVYTDNLATLSYSVDGVVQTNLSTTEMTYGASIRLFVSNINTNYTFEGWSVRADGLAETELDQGVDTFVIGDYDNYVVVAHFAKVKYIVNLATNMVDIAEVSFGTGEKIQKRIEYDETWSIRVDSIVPGFHFVEWELVDNLGQIYTGSITTPEFEMEGITKNWTCTAIFSINVYQIELKSIQNGTMNQTAQVYTKTHGDRFAVTVTPSAGYYLQSWVDGDGNILGLRDTLDILVEKNMTIQAQIDVIKYGIYFDSQVIGENTANIKVGGECYVYYDTNNELVDNKFDIGTEAKFAVVVPHGLSFDSFEMQTTGLKSGDDYVFNTDGTGAIFAINSDIFIVCKFNVLTVNVVLGTNATSGVDFEYILGSRLGKYSEMTTTQLSTFVGDKLSVGQLENNNDSQYVFAHWLINGKPYNKTKNIAEITVGSDMEIIAVFDVVQYMVTVGQNMAGGVLSGVDKSKYDYAEKITLVTTVSPGYRLIGWYDNVTDVKIGDQSSMDLDVTKDMDIEARYAKQGVIYCTQSMDDAGVVTGGGVFDYGQNIQLTASINPNYEFLYWVADNQILSKQTTLNIVVDSDVLVVNAIFAGLQYISIKSNDTEMGVVSGASQYAKLGEAITVKAIANENYRFVGWMVNDNLISTDATLSLAVNGSMDLEAKFAEDINPIIFVIVGGCVVLAVLLIVIIVHFVRRNERKSSLGRHGWKSNNLKKKGSSNYMGLRVESDNTRIIPIPVRKVTVPPMDYNGNIKTTRAVEVLHEEEKRGRGRPKGSLNKKGRKTVAPMHPGQRGRPKGSLNKKGRKLYVVKNPGKRGRPLGSKNKPK
ncbi:MAG: InlB B-repeat-containing protein [Clostridia bacterium]|nr:InlB B-repeat-containing protein [Clostridia bacterium]